MLCSYQEDWSEVDPSIDETVYCTVKAELMERVRAAQTSQAALVALLKSSMFGAADNQQVLSIRSLKPFVPLPSRWSADVRLACAGRFWQPQ